MYRIKSIQTRDFKIGQILSKYDTIAFLKKVLGEGAYHPDGSPISHEYLLNESLGLEEIEEFNPEDGGLTFVEMGDDHDTEIYSTKDGTLFEVPLKIEREWHLAVRIYNEEIEN